MQDVVHISTAMQEMVSVILYSQGTCSYVVLFRPWPM